MQSESRHLRRTWIEVRQQAAEEDLEMPVVLEEFGCKLDARPDQYRLAYDSCLTSAKRGGSCAGVMFWDLAHKVTLQRLLRFPEYLHPFWWGVPCLNGYRYLVPLSSVMMAVHRRRIQALADLQGI